MKLRITLFFALCTLASSIYLAQADLRDGLVSYWPLDTTDGSTTPDVTPHSNHLNLINMSGPDFVTGVRGNAASFDGASKYLNFTYTAGEDNGLPIYNARYYTISMWVKGTGASQQTRAVFAEASSTVANPLFALRTDTAASGRTNLLAAIIRNDNNNSFFGAVAFANGKSTLMPFDGNWHHIAWVDSNGTARLYVDGQLDPHVYNNTRLPEPTGTAGTLTLNTFSLGAVVSTTVGSYFSGLIDDAAVWERALTQDEINQVRTNGIPTPIAAAPPAIVSDPVGNTNLVVGEFFSLQALASGVHPRTYQWLMEGAPLSDGDVTNESGVVVGWSVQGSTNAILVLTNLQTTNSGGFSVIISNSQGSVTSGVANLLVSTVSPQVADLTNGQVAYWPLDTVQGITTPDVVRGQDLFLYQLSAANLAPGKWGNAMKFNTNGMLCRLDGSGDALPISQYQEFTVSAWVNSPAMQAPGGGGQRFYCEARGDASNPTLSLANGDNNTTPRGPWTKARAFMKNDGGQNNADAGSTALDIFYDPAVTNSTWHHVVYVEKWVGGAKPMVVANWYVDGVKDDPTTIGNQPCSPRLPRTGGVLTAIGGQWRNGGNDPLGSGGKSYPFGGLIDDVAVWNRALTAEEIVMLSTNVTPAAPAVLPALAINTFQGDFAEVVNGDSLRLMWNVAGLSGGGLTLSIDQGVGSVLGKTTNGIGLIVVTNITSSKTFTLTAQRGTNVVTAQTSVSVVNGVAAGWSILDDFQAYSSGALVNPYWADYMGHCTVEDIGGNHMLNVPFSAASTGEGVQLLLGLQNINEGQARTLFARIYVYDDTTNTTMGNVLAVTDKSLKDASYAGTDTGPAARFQADSGGNLAVGAYNGVGSTLTLIPRKLEQGQVYNLWIDVTNGPFYTNVVDGITNTGDTFSIWIQRLGETSRTLIASNYVTDRDLVDDFLGPTLKYLNKVVVANSLSSGTVYVDDLYISKLGSGYNSTVPVAWAGPTPPALSVPTLTADTTSSPGQILFSWSAGALMWAPTLDGPWTVVPDSVGFTYTLTIDPATPQQFFRAQR